MNGQLVSSGVASPGVSLVAGTQTTVSALVTAEDGVTQALYSAAVERISNDATLSGISFSPVATLIPTFSPSVTNYAVLLQHSTSGVTCNMPVMHPAATSAFYVDNIASSNMQVVVAE